MTDGWTGYKQLEKLDYIFGRFLCPSNDQNRRDGRAWIVANDHLDDPASSVLLRSFAKRMVLRMTKTYFWSDWAEIRTRHVPSIRDAQYKNGPTVQELEQSDR